MLWSNLRFVSALGFGIATLAAPQRADACSCGGDARLVWPSDGGSLPANAALVFESECSDTAFASSADGFDATVDGMPATLVPAAGSLAGVGFVLDPPPTSGATVELSNCGSADECAASDGPYNQRLTYSVTEADNGVPRPPTLGDLDYVLAEAPLNCGEDPTPARDWTVAIKGESAADEPLIYSIRLGPEGDKTTRGHVFAVGAESLDVVLRRLEEDAGKSVCAEVETLDLAGNGAAAVSSCRTLGADETLDGCACSASGDSPPAWGLLTLVGLGAFRRRR